MTKDLEEAMYEQEEAENSLSSLTTEVDELKMEIAELRRQCELKMKSANRISQSDVSVPTSQLPSPTSILA